MFISVPALVTPSYLNGSLQFLYQLPISLEQETNCRRLLKKERLIILAFDHATNETINFKIVSQCLKNFQDISKQWMTDDSFFYFAEIEKCDFPLAKAVSDLIKGLEKLKRRE